MAAYRSPEDSGFELLTTFSSRARMEVLVADLYAGPVSRFDYGNSVYIEVLSGTLESVTDLRLFGGENALAIEQPDGAWEILQFGEAELLAPGRYRLSRLLRGQRGTEAAMAPMVPAGARVVVLDAALVPLPVNEADLGLPWNWRIGPAAKPVSDDSYTAQSFTPRGVGLRPFSAVHVLQPWRRARVVGDLTIRWVRRDRSLAADNWNAVEVPMSKASEAWRVEILDGAFVKRSLIHRVRTHDPRTHKRQATHYILGFEDGFPQEPTPESGDGCDGTKDEHNSEPTPDFRQSHLRNSETRSC